MSEVMVASEFPNMTGKPVTDAQIRKLWVEARERSWTKHQVLGRALEINAAGLDAFDRQEMSDLINAVISEPPWVDPRQGRLPL